MAAMRPFDMLIHPRASSVIAALCILDHHAGGRYKDFRAADIVNKYGWSYPTFRRGRTVLMDHEIATDYDWSSEVYRMDVSANLDVTLSAMVADKRLTVGEATMLALTPASKRIGLSKP